MKKAYSILAGVMLTAALCSGFAAVDGDATTTDTDTTSDTTATATATDDKKDAYAPTLGELVIEKLENTDQNAVSIATTKSVYLKSDVMQALKDSGDKVLVLKEVRGDTPIWKMTIRATDVLGDTAKAFKPNLEFTQNKQNGAVTVNIGKDGYSLNAKVAVYIPLVNTTLDKDVALNPDNLILWKYNTETGKWDKSQATLQVDENDMFYFLTASGGTYYIGNSAPTRKP